MLIDVCHIDACQIEVWYILMVAVAVNGTQTRVNCSMLIDACQIDVCHIDVCQIEV